MKIRIILAIASVLLSAHALAINWTDTEFVGRTVQANNNLDAFDFFSGTSSVVQKDFSIKIGSTSYFPLTRTMNIDHGASDFYLSETMVLAYGLGQINKKVLASFCEGRKTDGTFNEIIQSAISAKIHTGTTVTFDNFIFSKSKWKAKCTVGDSTDLFHIMSPDGWFLNIENQTVQWTKNGPRKVIHIG